jgi:PKD domain-containing protein
MVRGFALASVFLALAAPASAAPGFTPAFPVDGAAVRPVMAPDGTVVVAEPPASVQVRPPGGPLGAVQALGGASSQSIEIAAGGDGRVVAAWVEGGDVRVATLMPGATSFGSPITLEPQADTAQAVVLDVDGAGNATALWWTVDPGPGAGDTTSRLRATTIPADGTAPFVQLLEQVTAPAGLTTGYLAIALDANAAGAEVAAWTHRATQNTTSSDHLRGAVRAAGHDFGPPQLLDQAANDSAGVPSADSANLDHAISVAINEAGDVGASWIKVHTKQNEYPDLAYAPGTVSGGFGALEFPVEDGFVYGDPHVVIDQDGRATLALQGYVNKGTLVRPHVTFRPWGGSFGALTAINPTGGQADVLALAVAPNGTELLVYSSSDKLYAAVAPHAGTFGAEQPIGMAMSAIPGAALGASGDGVVSWYYRDVTNGGIDVSAAAGYDASPPVLRSLTVPSALTVGDSALFSVQPFDIWGPVTTTWSFGDGGSADGASVSHTFDSAGDRTVSVTATDGVGNASTASGPVSVSAPPVPAGQTPPDTTKPTISSFAASPSTFAVGPKSTPLVAKVARGTNFKFQLSELSSVTIAIARQLPGKRSGKRCVPPSRRLSKKKSCKRYKTVGTLKRSGVAGANKLAFTGRLGRKALARGRYRATISATDAAGNKSAAKTASFRIVKFR